MVELRLGACTSASFPSKGAGAGLAALCCAVCCVLRVRCPVCGLRAGVRTPLGSAAAD